MKKAIIPSLVILLISFVSCKKDIQNQSAKSELTLVNKKVIEQVISMNANDQNLAYKSLTIPEKVYLWRSHIQEYIDSAHFTKDQVSHLRVLYDEISINLFNTIANDSVSRLDFQLNFENKWMDKAVSLFTNKELKALLYNIDHYQSIKSLQEFPIDSAKKVVLAKSCDCNQGSIFTCSDAGDCKKSICGVPSFEGCGFLRLYDCNGLCDGTISPANVN